jgi:hypothetical protein
LFSTELLKEPTTYQEALNCERKGEQIKWENEINNQLKEMKKEIFGKLLMRKKFQVIDNVLRII